MTPKPRHLTSDIIYLTSDKAFFQACDDADACILSEAPREESAAWKCNKCGHKMTAEEVSMMMTNDNYNYEYDDDEVWNQDVGGGGELDK